MVLFGGVLVLVPEMSCMVDHSLCVLFLWSQFSLSLFCHNWFLCASMSLFILVFLSRNVGSLESVLRARSRSSILALMLSGSGVWWDFILPLGMLCLSARRMVFVRVWLDL